METVSEIIGNMREIAPAGQRRLDDTTLQQLRDLTQSLIAAVEGAAGEQARFLAVAERELCLPEAELADRLRDATVLVTGGTGCIGSTLIGPAGCAISWPSSQRQPRYHRRLAEARPAQSTPMPTSGTAPPWTKLMGEVKPDLMFHVAGAARPGIGRGAGAAYGIYQRARYPQRADRRRGGRGVAGGLRFDRQGSATVLPRHIHRVQARRGVGRVKCGGR